jgi:hypothetical protein
MRETCEECAIPSSTFRIWGSKFRKPRTANFEHSSVSLVSPITQVSLRYRAGQISNLR